MAPPISNPSTLGNSCSIDIDLARYLGAAEYGDERTLRIGERAAEIVELGLHQKSRHRGAEMFSDTYRRRVCAVRSAKSIVDEEIPELCERSRQALIVLLLTAEKARVLEEQQLALLAAFARLLRLVGVRRLDENDFAPGQLARVARRQAGESTWGPASLWAARDARESPGREPRSSRSSIVGSAARMRVSSVIATVVIQGNVEIDADEGPLAAHLRVAEIADGFLSHVTDRLEAGPHEAQHVDAARCVSPLVVVPAMHDDQISVDDIRRLAVENARRGIADVVARHELLLCVAKDPHQWTFGRRLFEGGVHRFLGGAGFLDLDRKDR